MPELPDDDPLAGELEDTSDSSVPGPDDGDQPPEVELAEPSELLADA